MEPGHDEPGQIVALFNYAKTFSDKECGLMKQTLRFGCNDVQEIWRKKSKAFLPKNATPTLKQRGGSMMFWGYSSSRGT